MNDIIVYGVILLSIVALLAIFIWAKIFLKKKYNISDDDIIKNLEFGSIILTLMTHISSKFDTKYKDEISKVLKYVMEAFKLVITYENIDKSDLTAIKTLVLGKTRDICVSEGIEVDSELELILSEAVDFVIANYLFK